MIKGVFRKGLCGCGFRMDGWWKGPEERLKLGRAAGLEWSPETGTGNLQSD